jgi:sn-glycerol 3-phosphate transport system substrate-binding protein
MKEYLSKRPQAQVAVNQLVHARPWFATFKTVPVRKALEDEVQAVLSGKKSPKEALAAAQKAADEILAPYNKETSLRNF